MKAILLATVGVMLSSGLSYAKSPSGPKSGHPAVLTNAECNGVWKDAVGGGDILTRDKAAGYISDFAKADANRDGKISQAEFRQACKKGLVRAEHAESAKMGKDRGLILAVSARARLFSRARCEVNKTEALPPSAVLVRKNFFNGKRWTLLDRAEQSSPKPHDRQAAARQAESPRSDLGCIWNDLLAI